MDHHQPHQNPMSPPGTVSTLHDGTLDSQAYYQQQQAHAEKGAGAYNGQHGTYQDQSQYQQYPNGYGAEAGQHYPQEHSAYPATAGAAPTSNSAGKKRGVFCCGIALVALLLALVIGLGAGLGVSQRNLHQAQSDLAAASASLASAPPATATSPTTTTRPTSTQSSATASPTVNNVECPAKNGTFYNNSQTGKRFIKYCGRDYGDGEADNLDSVKTTTFDSCIDACANTTSCQGAGWGVLDGDKDNKHSCWMKTNITTKFHNATPEWHFALMVPGTGSSIKLF